MENRLYLFVIYYACRRLGQDTLGSLGGTRDFHRLVHGTDEQHLTVYHIEVVTHIHAIQAFDLFKVATDT